MYQNVDEFIKNMRKYQPTDKTKINKLIMNKGDAQDAETMKLLMRNPHWRKVYQQATEEITTKDKHAKYNYFEQFMTMTNVRDKIDDRGRHSRLRSEVVQGAIHAVREAHDRNIRTVSYDSSQEKYPVFPKTFLLTRILPFKDMVGSHITSKEFPFQECIHKSVILINELTLATQQECELYKNILGGSQQWLT